MQMLLPREGFKMYSFTFLIASFLHILCHCITYYVIDPAALLVWAILKKQSSSSTSAWSRITMII